MSTGDSRSSARSGQVPVSRGSVERGGHVDASAQPTRPVLPVDDEITGEVLPFTDEEPTAPIPAATVAAAVAATREDEFRTVHVTFEEILARVGPQHLGGPLPPIRDELYTTTGEPDAAPVSTTSLDDEWSDS